MIYCWLKGGLGNILFQIAACHHMSYIKKTECHFPNFSLLLGQIKNYYQNEKAQEYSTFLPINEGCPSATQRLKKYSYPFHYDEILPFEKDFVVDGFFQSEKYFVDSRQKILDLFKPTKAIEEIIQQKYSYLLNEECVSVHIRRGDYLNLQEHHPIQTIQYYEGALSFIKNKKQIKNVLVFSDDQKWCRENLNFDNMFFIENEIDYVELFLMSKCQNNIICNSSFSWWGAWLNQNKDKIVVAPKKWFGRRVKHITSDIIPENWKRL